MKFENDYFKVLIEKKELTSEQKEAAKLRWKKRRPVMIVAALLIAAILGSVIYGSVIVPKNTVGADAETAGNSTADIDTGGNHSDNTGNGVDTLSVNTENDGGATTEETAQVEGEYVATAKLATGIREKYADKNLYGYTYGEPIEEVGRDEAITFKLGYDVDDLGIDMWTEVYALYLDPELTYRMNVKYDFDPETYTFIMAPSDWGGVCMVSLMNVDVGTAMKYPHNEYSFFDEGAGTNWGNWGTAYLACYRDKETGEVLEQPEVSIVTFKGEIEEPPKLSYYVTAEGRLHFYWNEVEGATDYFLCEMEKTERKGYGNTMYTIAITEETSWTSEYPEYGDRHGTANGDFKIFSISEDDWKDEDNYEYNLERYEEPGIPATNYWDGKLDSGICVIAVNEEGTSMISNVCELSEIAPKVPYKRAHFAEEENGFAQLYETVEQIPTYDYVTMCDGYTVTRLIDYDIENAYIEDKQMIVSDGEEQPRGKAYTCLCIPFRVEGTSFMDVFTVIGIGEEGYNEADFEKDIAYLADREEKLSRKGGDIAPEFSLQFAEKEEISVKEVRRVETEIFANTALGEYLATNMLGGAKIIDLREFPEARDKNFVDDAFMEAYYQNPLILGIKGYKISKNGKSVRVIYEENAKSQAQKQEEIKDKISDIIAKIITEDMTEQEKELAINQYLCDNVVYDEDALANAEENNFMTVDEEFNDSFTAYGALINGKCVCAGYAAAFTLLAQEAGLESIVVTGYLDGTLAHAWNKVKIDDEWQIVDVTNNDNEYFFNALLNLPSSVGDNILVEDEEYMTDILIPRYTGESDENEYYHIMDNYFPTQEVAEVLAKQLAEDGTATLRTDYELTDNEFYEITDTLYELMGVDTKLYGHYWLGVIYLETAS